MASPGSTTRSSGLTGNQFHCNISLKKSTYSRAAQEHPPLMKGVSSVLVKVKPCRKGAQHQSKTQHLENSSKANTKLQSWAGRVALWAAAQRTGQQEAACACWRSLGHSQAPTLVTYLTPLVKPCKTHNQWHPLPRHSHTHTLSVLNFSLLTASAVK